MAEETNREQEGLAWQTGVWDRLSEIYLREIDKRFVPVIDHVIARARLRRGQEVLDLGTGTGAVAVHAAPLVVPDGEVVGVDISPEMLALARRRVADLGLTNVSLREGRAEAIPAEDETFDALLASLSLMYAVDRSAGAWECARVLRRGGRFVASVWGPPEQCDIVRFQQTVGRFAPTPPVPGVGPGALADPTPFLAQLADASIQARVETETIVFDFPNLASAWQILAGVTVQSLTPEEEATAKAAVSAAMWPDPEGPREFRNLTQFIVGQRAR